MPNPNGIASRLDHQPEFPHHHQLHRSWDFAAYIPMNNNVSEKGDPQYIATDSPRVAVQQRTAT